MKRIILSLLMASIFVGAVNGATVNSYRGARNSAKGVSQIEMADSGSIDAFGRFRVSNPLTLFDSKNIMDDDDIANTAEQQPLFYDNQETSGTGTSTSYDPDKACQLLTVSNATAGTRTRQTRQRFNYQPGKSLEIIMSFLFGTQATGITRREGYFDDRNGIYLEDDGTNSVYKIVRRTYTSGAAVNNTVTQNAWNIDPLDGTGKSGKRLDFTKTQLLFIDIEWLGVGRVRVGFVIDGLIYYVHEFLNANVLDSVYMSSPNLPLRSQIVNDGNGVTANMTQICSTVISEGGQDTTGIVFSASSEGTHADAATENAIVPLIGIRLKPEAVTAGISIDLESVYALIYTTSDRMELFWLLDPTISGTFTYSDVAKSAVQVAKWEAATNVASGGTRLGPSFFTEAGGNPSGGAGSAGQNIVGQFKLGSLIDGTPDAMVLCGRPIAGSADVDVEYAISWREK